MFRCFFDGATDNENILFREFTMRVLVGNRGVRDDRE